MNKLMFIVKPKDLKIFITDLIAENGADCTLKELLNKK